jgi:hypothetical protein
LDRAEPWTHAFWVWAVVLVAAVVVRRRLRNADRPGDVRLGQITAVVSTLTVPILIPAGIYRAFRARRSRTGRGSSNVRIAAVVGSIASGFVLVGLIAQDRAGAFERVRTSWPSSVSAFYDAHWPTPLQPDKLVSYLVPLGIATGAILLLGLWGAWLGLDEERAAQARVGELIGIIGGAAAGLIALPVLLTGVGLLLYGALMIAVAVVIIWIVGAMLADSC